MKTLKKKKNIYETVFVVECEGISVYNGQIRWRWQNASVNLKMQYNKWHRLNTKTNILTKTYEKEIYPDDKGAVLKLIVEYERYKGKKKVSEKV